MSQDPSVQKDEGVGAFEVAAAAPLEDGEDELPNWLMDAQDSDDDDHPRKVQAAEVIQRRVRGVAGRSQAQMRAEAALVREEEEAALEIARLTNQLELLKQGVSPSDVAAEEQSTLRGQIEEDRAAHAALPSRLEQATRTARLLAAYQRHCRKLILEQSSWEAWVAESRQISEEYDSWEDTNDQLDAAEGLRPRFRPDPRLREGQGDAIRKQVLAQHLPKVKQEQKGVFNMKMPDVLPDMPKFSDMF
eukprot:TRINITY_DN11132_c0_g1_i1.p1 TRINITY_DN11132_c0_g1~~TRINITY_DN11132_c0_g1_i1.p1  ORF type:complete len:247 (+),score=60.68 TRINITY_DN11132_c0_g1_i1:278-1018(+)